MKACRALRWRTMIAFHKISVFHPRITRERSLGTKFLKRASLCKSNDIAHQNHYASVLSPKITCLLLRSKWAAGKAVRAGLAVEGAYLNRYVTDEQRGRQPVFIATLWAGASWPFFLRRGGSIRMTQIWALRSRLEKSAAAEPPAKGMLFRRQDTKKTDSRI
jgi:hypothetical protein